MVGLRRLDFACTMGCWLIAVLGWISFLLINSVATVGLFILVVSVVLFYLFMVYLDAASGRFGGLVVIC